MGNSESAPAEEEVADGLVPARGKARDMCLAQLERYGADNAKGHVYVSLRGEIFDVSEDLEGAQAFKEWFGRDKADATDEELESLRSKYVRLGKLIEQRVISAEELAKATGEGGAPIYVAARGLVFDVTAGASFYGPEGGYHLFAGHNAQRALALMSLNADDVVNTSLEDLEPKDLKVLDDWIDKYYDKYPLIGTLAQQTEQATPKEDTSAAAAAAEEEDKTTAAAAAAAEEDKSTEDKPTEDKPTEDAQEAPAPPAEE